MEGQWEDPQERYKHPEVSTRGKVTFLSPRGTLIPGTTETVTTETAGVRQGDTGPVQEPSPPRASTQTRRLFSFSRAHLPGRAPPAPSTALPNPR